MKTDRARIQVGRISGFGLLEMSRQRLRPGMLEASTQPCPSCHGTGLIRSDDSVGLTILRQLEEEGVRRRTREVLVKAPVSIINFLMNMKREHIAQIEARYGMAVRLEADPYMISPDFTVEKFKTATRRVEAVAPVVSVDPSLMADLDEEIAAEEEAAETSDAPEAQSDEDRPKKRRRRRRRRRSKGGEGQGDEAQASENTEGEETSETTETAEEVPAEAAEADAPEAAEEKPKRKRTRRKKADADAPASEEASTAASDEPAAETIAEDAPAEEKPKRKRTRRKKKEPEIAAEVDVAETAEAPVEPVVEQSAPAPEPEPEPEPVAPDPMPEPEPVVASEPAVEQEPAKPRKRGWWSMGR